MGSQRDCTWILGLPGFRVERIEGHAVEADRRLRVFTEGRAALSLRRVWPMNGPCSADEGTDVGRSAVGSLPGDTGLSPATRQLPPLRASHRRRWVRRRESPGDPPVAASDRRGLSVDADQSCGRASLRMNSRG